ncbi:MAG: hypothetical protein K2L73_01120 [Muribaculaceae bacterium]|nr:hypothetical protein [Muribaculaceae bacterium]
MTTIERTAELRSAFLKIGWAPLVTICGVILLCIIAIVIAVITASTIDDGLSTMKIIITGSSLITLAGYFLTYAGFAQAQKAFGATKAGEALSTLKIIFLIFTIIGAATFFLMLLLPDRTEAYLHIAENASENPDTVRAIGGVFIILYLLMSIYSLVALFIIKSKTKKLAASTNIRALNSAYTGALMGVITFFASLVTGVVSGLTAGGNEPSLIPLLCELFTLGIAIYALVKWIGGWLGAATEVMRHEVEAAEYNDRYTLTD